MTLNEAKKRYIEIERKSYPFKYRAALAKWNALPAEEKEKYRAEQERWESLTDSEQRAELEAFFDLITG